METIEQTTELAVNDERSALAAELAADPARDRIGSFPSWYLSVLTQCDAMEDRIKEQAEKLLAQVNARRRALEWRFGREFREIVEKDLAEQNKGKTRPKKSVDYALGKAGFRTTRGSMVFRDAQELEAWASEHLPAAIKFTVSKTAVTEYIKETGEVPPGCEWNPPHDKFFPAVDQPQLEEDCDG